VDDDLAQDGRAVPALIRGPNDALRITPWPPSCRPGISGPRHSTVAGVTGVALGLCDPWLSGRDPHAPAGLSRHARLPDGHWTGERAAIDVLALAGKARAFRSLDKLTGTTIDDVTTTAISE
jgi:hypothetical protein